MKRIAAAPVATRPVRRRRHHDESALAAAEPAQPENGLLQLGQIVGNATMARMLAPRGGAGRVGRFVEGALADVAPATESAQTADAPSAEAPSAVLQSHQQVVFFDVNSDKLKDPEHNKLKSWWFEGAPGVNTPPITPDTRFRVSEGEGEIDMLGQASPTGSAVYNQDLSRRRVQHVEQLMRDFTGAKSHLNPTATGIPVGVKSGGEQAEFRRVVVSFETPGASPGPQPGPNPAPQPGPTPNNQLANPNPELEDMFDVIWLQYQMMLKHQNDALNRLDSDLTTLESPSDLKKDILEAVIKTAIGALWSPAAGSLQDLFKKVLEKENMEQEDRDRVVDSGVKPILDEAEKFAVAKVTELATALDDKGVPKLNTFIETQRGILDTANDAAQEVFLTTTKRELRNPPRKPLPPGEQKNADPRVDVAGKLLKTLKNEKQQATDKQYDRSLEAWSAANAQAKAGTTRGGILGTQDVTDMKKADTDTPGVVVVNIDGDKPNKPVKVESAKIAGLSEKVRDKLNKQNRSLDGLGMPILATGPVNPSVLPSPIDIKPFNARIKIGQSERDDVVNIDSTDGGKQWLKERVAADNGLTNPGEALNQTEENGARSVFQNDLRNKKLSDVGGLQKA